MKSLTSLDVEALKGFVVVDHFLIILAVSSDPVDIKQLMFQLSSWKSRSKLLICKKKSPELCEGSLANEIRSTDHWLYIKKALGKQGV